MSNEIWLDVKQTFWLCLVIHRFEQPLTNWRGQSRWTWGWWKREQVRLMYRGPFPSQTNLCPLGQPASAQTPFAIATCYLTSFTLLATELRNLLHIRCIFWGKFLYGLCVSQNWHSFYWCQLKLHERRSSHVSSWSCLSRYTYKRSFKFIWWQHLFRKDYKKMFMIVCFVFSIDSTYLITVRPTARIL